MNEIDFVVHIKHKKNIKILQITDFQPVDYSQQRYKGRINIDSKPFTENDLYTGLFYYIERLVKETNPDLIMVTGDNVYGEFDDNGSNMIRISKYLDSLEIPWAPIFGNHDNESKKGVAWQCKIFEESKNCLFKRRELTGNGNYNIGLFRDGKIEKIIYMVDSNGCGLAKNYSYYKPNYPDYNLDEKVETRIGIFPDQIKWIEESSKLIDSYYNYEITKFISCHIPPDFVSKQAVLNKYISKNDGLFDLDSLDNTINNDFGHTREHLIRSTFNSLNLLEVLKKGKFNGMFVGHNHISTLSILCDNFIRVTFGVKTGEFDYHDDIGGTLITLKQNGNFNIKHIIINR